MHSNPDHLVLEATTLPTNPQPLPKSQEVVLGIWHFLQANVL